VGGGDIAGQRLGGILHDRYPLAISGEVVVDAMPTRSVHEGTIQSMMLLIAMSVPAPAPRGMGARLDVIPVTQYRIQAVPDRLDKRNALAEVRIYAWLGADSGSHQVRGSSTLVIR
jgi:hypothetical protein